MSAQALKLKSGVVEIPLPRQTTYINYDFDYIVRWGKEELALSQEDALSFAQRQFEEIQGYVASLRPDDVLFTAARPAEHWIVGRCIAATRQRVVWDLAGIFDTEDKAVRACRDESDFVMPVPVNVPIPQDTSLSERAYYPLLTHDPVPSGLESEHQ